MFLLNWYREWKTIRQEFRKECQSCETLRIQLETERMNNQQLLGALVARNIPAEAPPQQANQAFNPIKPRVIPWSQRKQMLESEDRQTAFLLRKQREDDRKARDTSPANQTPTKSSAPLTTQEIEKELGIEDAGQTGQEITGPDNAGSLLKSSEGES